MKFSKCIDCHFQYARGSDYQSMCSFQEKTSHSVEYPDCIFVANAQHSRFLSTEEFKVIFEDSLVEIFNDCKFSADSLKRHKAAVNKLCGEVSAGPIVR